MPGEGRTRSAEPPRIAARGDVERLVEGLLARMDDLGRLLETETADIRVGRIREGLANEPRKGELAAHYMAGLEAVKANAVALARLAPDALDRLRHAHARFGTVVQANQNVLATARAVTEGLIKSIADDLARAARPQVYGGTGAMAGDPRAMRGEPLVVSKRL
jgi:hypothetical protein